MNVSNVTFRYGGGWEEGAKSVTVFRVLFLDAALLYGTSHKDVELPNSRIFDLYFGLDFSLQIAYIKNNCVEKVPN